MTLAAISFTALCVASRGDAAVRRPKFTATSRSSKCIALEKNSQFFYHASRLCDYRKHVGYKIHA